MARAEARLSGRVVMLSVAQLLPAIYAIVAAMLVPSGETYRSQSLAAAAVLIVLAAVTMLLVRRTGVRVLYVVLSLTAMTLAYLTATRVTGQGQMAFGLFLLMLSVWIASFVAPVSGLAMIAFGVVMYLIALVVDPILGTPIPAVAMVATIAFSTGTILHSRAIRIRYERLVEDNSDVVFSAKGSELAWVSPAIETQFGWTQDEFMRLGDAKWHPDDALVVDRLRAQVAAGLPATGTYRLKLKDGGYHWVETRLTPFRDEDGALGAIGSLRDVEERVEAQLALAELTKRYRRISEELERSQAETTRRLQEVSHELRTPLTVIRGPLERQLRKDADLPEGLRVDIEAAVRASRRLESLVNGLLDDARETDTGPITLETVDVAALTAECMRLVQPATGSLSLRLNTADDFPARLRFDTDAWRTIVQNLLSNALKYTASGEVVVCQAYDGRNVVLTVADTGYGISEADVERIFDRFYVAEDAATTGEARSGLGLAMVASAISRMGGRIDVASELGKGSTFTVTIPALALDALVHEESG